MSSSSGSGSLNGDVPENLRLFMGGIPLNKTRMEVSRALLTSGVPGVTNVIMYKNNCDTRKNRGYVFVEFSDHVTASIVLDSFRGVLCLFGKHVFMDWANPATQVQTGAMDEVKILFIRGITTMMNKEEFKTILANIVKNTSFEKVFKDQGHAFVHFFTRRAAEQALVSLQAALRMNRYAHLQWEVKWAIPQERIVISNKTNNCPLCAERRLYDSWYNTVSSVVSAGCAF